MSREWLDMMGVEFLAAPIAHLAGVIVSLEHSFSPNLVLKRESYFSVFVGYPAFPPRMVLSGHFQIMLAKPWWFAMLVETCSVAILGVFSAPITATLEFFAASNTNEFPACAATHSFNRLPVLRSLSLARFRHVADKFIRFLNALSCVAHSLYYFIALGCFSPVDSRKWHFGSPIKSPRRAGGGLLKSHRFKPFGARIQKRNRQTNRLCDFSTFNIPEIRAKVNLSGIEQT